MQNIFPVGLSLDDSFDLDKRGDVVPPLLDGTPQVSLESQASGAVSRKEAVKRASLASGIMLLVFGALLLMAPTAYQAMFTPMCGGVPPHTTTLTKVQWSVN